jgi:hypothetical protein
MAHQPEDWPRLGVYVLREASDRKNVKTVLGIARSTQLNPKTVRKLINGHPVRRDTLLTLEAWLGWEPGSMDAVLRGGEPTRTTETDMGAAERLLRQRSPELRDQIERDLWDTLATIALTYEERLAKLYEFRARQESHHQPSEGKKDHPPPNTGTEGNNHGNNHR